MSNKIANRVKMTVSGTPGTGTITLGSAVAGFQSFAAASVSNADTVPYIIEDGAAWEIGVGTYTATGTTMSRSVTASSNSGNPINATSAAIVMISPLAADLQAGTAAGNLVRLDGSARIPAVDGSLVTNLNATQIATGTISASRLPSISLTTGVTGTLPVANGGTGVTTSTGTGSVVLSNSPTLVTPALGTPSSGNLANCTFPTLNQNTTGTAANVTGTVAVANGGTGLTSLTAGRIPYGAGVSGTDPFGNSANLFWDATNSRLGIGTASPGNKLDIVGGGWAQSSASEVFNVTTRTGAGADGNYIGNVGYRANNSSSVIKDYVRLLFQQATSTAGSENGVFFLQASRNGSLFNGLLINGSSDTISLSNSAKERLRIEAAGTVNIVGAGTAGSTQAVSFNGSAPINSMVLDANGTLGIGTSTPRTYSKLHVSATDNPVFVVEDIGSGVGYFSQLGTNTAIGAETQITFSTGVSFFSNGPVSSGTERARIDSSGNLLVGTTTSPTTGTQCLTIETGTAPTASPADTITIYSTDLSAGNTMLSIYTEGTAVGTGTPTANRTIAVRINGTVYYLLASTIP